MFCIELHYNFRDKRSESKSNDIEFESLNAFEMDERSESQTDYMHEGKFKSDNATNYKLESKAIELITDKVVEYFDNLINVICLKDNADK